MDEWELLSGRIYRTCGQMDVDDERQMGMKENSQLYEWRAWNSFNEMWRIRGGRVGGGAGWDGNFLLGSVKIQMPTIALAGVAHLVEALSHTPKGWGLHFWSGHITRLQGQSLVGACMGSNQSLSCCLSLPLPSLHFSLKSINIFKKFKCLWYIQGKIIIKQPNIPFYRWERHLHLRFEG